MALVVAVAVIWFVPDRRVVRVLGTDQQHGIEATFAPSGKGALPRGKRAGSCSAEREGFEPSIRR